MSQHGSNSNDSNKRPLSRRAAGIAMLASATAVATGCAGRQYSHLLASDDTDMVGSHAAGAATWNPLVDQSVAQLLSRCAPVSHQDSQAAAMQAGQVSGFELASHQAASSNLTGGPTTVCFVGIENKSAEELFDFKDQLYERIDSQVNSAEMYRGVSRRVMEAALHETGLRPDSLYLPANRQAFAAALGRLGSPIDYLLYARITSGTTDRNASTQRDYLLTLEMVNAATGDYVKESAKIRKGYHKKRTGKWWNYGWFGQADG